jgi:hypothetical protein
MEKYKPHKFEQIKEDYQKDLLKSSYLNKFKTLIRIQEEALFFNKIRYNYSYSL